VRWRGGLASQVAVRNHAFRVGQPASFDTQDAAPSALEYLLGALGAALAAGIAWRLSRARLELRALEVLVRGRCANILGYLGLDDSGHPGLAGLEVQVYLDAEGEPARLDELVRESVARCPVTQSLERAVPVKVQWRSA
jgi:uncharacterized OsmC-like protein